MTFLCVDKSDGSMGERKLTVCFGIDLYTKHWLCLKALDVCVCVCVCV